MRIASNVVDSSAWLEYLADGPNADEFARAIEHEMRLIVPSLVITEVLRRLDALGRRTLIPRVLAHMRQGRIVHLNEEVAVTAAVLVRKHRLALADSVILATGRLCGATIWTQDEDFEGLDGVEYRPHVRARARTKRR